MKKFIGTLLFLFALIYSSGVKYFEVKAAYIQPLIACWENPDGVSECGRGGPSVDYFELSVVSVSDNLSSFSTDGHAFLILKNLRSYSINLNGLTIPSKSSITIGSFGNNSNHIGIFYNYEAIYATHFNPNGFNTGVYLKEKFEYQDYIDLDTYLDQNDTWSYLINCSTLAQNAWNLISDNDISAGFINTPHNLKDSIMDYNYNINPTLPQKDYYYYLENGSLNSVSYSI